MNPGSQAPSVTIDVRSLEITLRGSDRSILMPSYSPDFKDQMVKKMMPPGNQSVAQLSRETGISGATLYAWKKQFKDRGFVVPSRPSAPDRWDTLP